MARLVVLRFEDNNEADKFVASVPNKAVFYMNEEQATYELLSVRVSVLGTFMQPTQFCTCADSGNFGPKDGWSKGKKYGLWIHKCGKPSRQAAQRLGFVIAGRNLSTGELLTNTF